ncbi:MAG: F0F1 ATP synthase subunit A [Candidatus Firestonebacteria bacterium]
MEEGVLKEIILIKIPGIPDVVTMSWIVMVIIITLCLFAKRKISKSPVGLQNAVEYIVEWIILKSKEFLGENGPRFLPLFITLFLFILFSNLIGLIPGFKSPTSNINVTISLALIIFFSIHYFGIKEKGLWRYFKHFLGPPYWLSPILFPIHIISELARPLSLSIRLFGNIMAKEILLGILAVLFVAFSSIPKIGIILSVFPLILRPLIMLLGVLVSFIQALVFTLLSMVYIAGAIETGEQH